MKKIFATLVALLSLGFGSADATIPYGISAPTPQQIGAVSTADTAATIQPPFSNSVTPPSAAVQPTLTFNSSTTISGARTFYAIPTAAATNWVLSPYFTFSMSPAELHPYTLSAFNGTGAQSIAHYNINDAPFTTTFEHVGSQIDILAFGDGATTDVYVDQGNGVNQLIGHFTPQFNFGTAQAGSISTIKLAAGSSSTDGAYNQYYITTVGGTGSGQTRRIASYVGATVTATMAQNWSVATDGTTQYHMTEDGNSGGIILKPLDGSLNYINLNWNGVVAKRKFTVVSTIFTGVNIGPNDTLAPAAPLAQKRMVLIEDSIGQGVCLPCGPIMAEQLGRHMGRQVYNQSMAGTGWVARNASAGGLNFLDQIAPPTESFAVIGPWGSTGGTFKLSVTYNGVTQQTSALNYNSNAGTVCTALNALSNVPGGSPIVCGGSDGAVYRSLKVLMYSMSGATLTGDFTGLTGNLLTPSITQWLGSVAPNVPLDGNGNPAPFDLYVVASGNDAGSGSAAVGVNACLAANAINKKFPTATTVFTGIVATATNGTNGQITSTDVAFNTAIRNCAALLPKINGKVPFIDTYAAGVGNNAIIFGGGTVQSPTANTNDILRSFNAPAHPTGDGDTFLAAWLAGQLKFLFGAQ